MKKMVVTLMLVFLAGCTYEADYTVIMKADQYCGEGKVKSILLSPWPGIRIYCLDGKWDWVSDIKWETQ